MNGRWTENRDPDEPCPAVEVWAAFWADPPVSIEDPRLAEYREWVAEGFADLDFGESICPHCLEHAQTLEKLVEALEAAAMAQRDSGVTDR